MPSLTSWVSRSNPSSSTRSWIESPSTDRDVREQRVVRTLEPRACVVAKPVGGVGHDAPEFLGRALLQLAPDEPARPRRRGRLRHLEVVAPDLGPDVGLVPVHPRAAHLDLLARELGRPGPAAEAVAPLEQQDAVAPLLQLTGRR